MSSPSPDPESDFPTFGDADVELVVSPTRRYALHVGTLRRCSGLFNNLLRQSGPKLSKKALRKGVTIRYRLILAAVGPSLVWRRVELDRDGKTEDGSRVGSWNENGRMAPEEFDWYDKIFRAFYNLDMKIDKKSIGSIMRETVGIVDVAEVMDTKPALLIGLESALVSAGQDLLETIACCPNQWIDIAYRLRSRYLFKECLIHIVGRYNELSIQPLMEDQAPNDSRNALDDLKAPVRVVVQRKKMELDDKCRAIEQSIASYYPPGVERQSTSGRADIDDIGRKSYSNDIYLWMTLNLFRHWFGQQIAMDENHHHETGGYDFYRKLSAGGQAYLTKQDCADWHQHFPMTLKGQSVISNHLNVIKEAIRPRVKPLLEKHSQINNKSKTVQWLTCIRVTPADYPWENEPKTLMDVEYSSDFSDEDIDMGATETPEDGSENADDDE